MVKELVHNITVNGMTVAEVADLDIAFQLAKLVASKHYQYDAITIDVSKNVSITALEEKSKTVRL